MKKSNKKAILFAAAGLLVLVGLVTGGCVLANRRPKFVTLEEAGLGDRADIVLAAAHGLCALAPENSVPAFTLAAENGYDAVLFEARRTIDGIWIVMKEDNVRGATDGTGKVSQMTFKQVLRCHPDKGPGAKQYKNDPLSVPTLTQALNVCSNGGLMPVIDVRQSGADCVEELLNVIGSRKRKACVLIFSEEEQLNRAKELLTDTLLGAKIENVLLGRMTEELSEKALDRAKQTPDIAVCFSAKGKREDAVKRFADEGLTLFALGVNKPGLAKALYDAGVRRFTTDKLANQPILTEKEKIKEPEKTSEAKPDKRGSAAAESEPGKPSATAAEPPLTTVP